LILGLALLVLVLPGLPAIRFHNYRPFFTHGPAGFLSCLPPLFFAYAGFESLAQTAGEVKESRRRLPRIFLWGIAATTLIFLAMSVVTFGVLPGGRLAGSTTPMSDVAEVYLQSRAAGIVTLGALMALATSLNATMLVPSRLGVILAEDHLIPAWLGNVNRRTGTPITGLALTLAGSVLLLLSGQLSLALNIAVFALVSLYFLHSLALLLLPRLNRDLAASVQVAISPGWRQAAALLSMAAMGSLILVQIRQDLQVMALKTFMERWADGSLTSLELVVVWGVLGAGLYYFASRRAAALGWISRTGTRPAVRFPQDAGGKSAPAGTVKRRDPDGGECYSVLRSAETAPVGPEPSTPVKKGRRNIHAMEKRLNWFVEFYRSALGKKIAMGVSGVVLFGFILGHMAGNLKLFLGRQAFNDYADWLREVGHPAVPHGGLLWLARVVLLAAVAVHILAAVQLTRLNRKARPRAYVLKDVVQAGYAERTMRWSGLLVGLYVVYHLLHFTQGSFHRDFLPANPYHNVVTAFSFWPVAVIYIAANLLLGLHLYHGLWSLFQTLGLSHPRYDAWRRTFAAVFAVVVTAGFVAVPLAVLAGLVPRGS
ncbi:MAG: amino acid permease, partial [Acidobacteriota bacterium]